MKHSDEPRSTQPQLARSVAFIAIAFFLSAFGFPIAQQVATRGVRIVQAVSADAARAEATLSNASPRAQVRVESDIQRLRTEDKVALGLAAIAAVLVVSGSDQLALAAGR